MFRTNRAIIRRLAARPGILIAQGACVGAAVCSSINPENVRVMVGQTGTHIGRARARH
jgi:hypothetical protein